MKHRRKSAMSNPANTLTSDPHQPRSRAFWLLLGAVAAAQLMALWLLCSHQMRRAEARHNEMTVQQMALADCLQYIPGSTIASCTSRLDPAATATQASDRPAMSGALPVSFSYR
jgi:hypothetical protein